MMKYGLTIVAGPSIKQETTIEQYIGLDVSLKETFISVREGNKRIWRGKCPSDPKTIAEVMRKHAPTAARVVFETGPLSVWFYHALTAEGLPAICIDARHAKAALDMAANKTDANDADGIPGATKAEDADNFTHYASCDVTIAGRSNMCKIILDGAAIKRPFDDLTGSFQNLLGESRRSFTLPC